MADRIEKRHVRCRSSHVVGYDRDGKALLQDQEVHDYVPADIVDASYQPTVPGVFASPMVSGSKIGVRVHGFAPGIYDVWAQVTAPPETPVILAGSFQTI